jgi:hypothetical protein
MQGHKAEDYQNFERKSEQTFCRFIGGFLRQRKRRRARNLLCIPSLSVGAIRPWGDAAAA